VPEAKEAHMSSDIIQKGSLLEKDQILTEYRSRKKTYLEMRVDKAVAVPDGWTVKREFLSTRRLVRQKSVADQLEDKVWRLFYDLGAERLSSRCFTVTLKTRKGIRKTKEIDVLAVDDDVVFVVECKSRERLGKKQLRKDIAGFFDDMADVRNAMRVCLGVRTLKFVFIFATENIEWDRNDREDAREKGILVWDEYDLLALQELASLAGEGAKYQLYNRIFYEKRIKNFEVRVPALKAKMGGHTYYSFVLSPEHLLRIAYVHQRSGTCSFLELSDSYQRMMQKARIRRIESFIEEGGFFPGSIIVNFSRRPLKEEVLGDKSRLSELRQEAKPVVLTLPPYYGCAWVVDGQHRLYGYADTEAKSRDTVPIVAFVQEPAAVQAKMFVDINKNQKAIPPDLLWDLYEDLFSESQVDKEQQLWAISKIAKTLNRDATSPFAGCISIPKEQNVGNITLTTVCASISQQRLVARGDSLFFHKNYADTVTYAAERISAFFDIIRQELPDQWGLGDKHYVRTNAAFVVLSGILRDLVECNLTADEIADLRKFRNTVAKFLEPLLLHILDADNEQIRLYRAAGGASQRSRHIRLELTRVMRDASIGFRSTWLEQYEAVLKEEDRIAKRRLGLKYYLDKDEGESLEFKGSLALDVKRYLLGDGKSAESDTIAEDGALKTIVAFLNSKGGELVIGVLELSRFENVLEEKLSDCPVYADKIIFGLTNEYKKDAWDGFQQRLLSWIETRIGADVIDAELVKITKEQFEDKEICRVTVSPADAKQFLGTRFFVRRGNKTVLVEGQEIDRYWSRRGRPR
jgi:DNA sulfur modification protein DndB